MKKKVLDVTNYKCPMTFLKTKDFINKNKDHLKVIIIKGKKGTSHSFYNNPFFSHRR